MRSSLRRGRTLLLALLALALMLPGAAMAQDSGAIEIKPGDKLPNFVPKEAKEAVPGQIIVKFKEDVGLSAQANVRREEGLQKKADLALIDAEVDQVEGQSVEQAIRDLNARPNVEYAEPNGLLYPTGYADEPYFGYLWGLHNTGQTIGGYPGKSDVDINGKEASTVTQGNSNLTVAVIDDGVDFSHPDLSARAWKNPGESGSGKETNGVDDDGNGYVDDVNGWDVCHNDKTVHDAGDDSHGTHVAGTIAASSNGQGVVGVAPNVKIMALKFLSNGGTGTFCNSDAGAIKAIEYAKKKGIKLSNNSWGGYGYSQGLKDAIDASGSLFVAAAGNDTNDNDGTTPMYPASFTSSNILSVAAVHNEGGLSWFSNYGATSVDISAPGEDILSSVPGGSWEFWPGTSMAAPHVTGAAALVGSVNSGLLSKPVDLKNLIMNTGKPLSATSGYTVTGDMVNAKAAVDAAAPSDTVAPKGTIKINGGAVYTKSPSVKLSLSATDPSPGSGIASMRLGNDSGYWTAWQPYATSKSWTLRKVNGTRAVYVEYRDRAGNVSTTTLDTIKLDMVKPSIGGMSPKHKSAIKDTTPTIKAAVRDNMINLQKANIKLYMGGKLISAKKYSYNAKTDVLLYNSPKLSKGKKVVKIVATDAAKNVGAKSWYFTIK